MRKWYDHEKFYIEDYLSNCRRRTRKTVRCWISILVAVVLFMTNTDILELLRLENGVKNQMVVRAADDYDTKYDVLEYTTDQTILLDGEEAPRPYYSITTKADLIWYSQSYYKYEGHERDVIEIDYGDGQTTGPFDGYESIGNDRSPYNGRIYFGQTTSTVFNIDCPLFGTVYDSVEILEKNTNVVKTVTITRTSEEYIDAEGHAHQINEPLLARKVKSDAESAINAVWNVEANYYSYVTNNTTYPFAGVIREMEAGAAVQLNFANNATYDGNVAAIGTVSGDIGILCGKMGENSSLTATYTGTSTGFAITTGEGNAGGFVGSMEPGAMLGISLAENPQGNAGTAVISAEDGYAGGIVGQNNGGSVTVTVTGGESAAPYPIRNVISGTTGVGAVYGFYSPAMTEGAADFDISLFDIDATVTGTGSVGGLFGVLQNDGGIITLKTSDEEETTVITRNASEDVAEKYGGLIGTYQAVSLGDELIIDGLKANVIQNGTADYYGGFIGYVGGVSDVASYVKMQSVELTAATAAGNLVFGGLVGKTDRGYIYVNGATVGTDSSEISGYMGGALVGDLGNGVLGLAGAIDVTYAVPSIGDNSSENSKEGLLVGFRDHALVYAENGCVITQNASTEADNIGSWGDVLCFGDSLAKSDVFTETASHTITMNTVNTDAIGTVADYAIASILFQIDMNRNSVISGSSLAQNVPLTFVNDAVIDLTGTGLRGITRDHGDGSEGCYTGTVTGNNATVKLDIHNVGSAAHPVYRHMYQGVFGRTDGVAINGLNLNGSIFIKAKGNQVIAAGAAVGNAKGSFTISDVSTLSTLEITLQGGERVYAGRLLGEAGESIGNISVSNSEFDGSVLSSNTNGDTYLGGVIGRISCKTNHAHAWEFTNVTIKGTVNGSNGEVNAKANQRIGGLIAGIAGYDSNGTTKQQRVLTLQNVVLNGLTVQGKASGSLGGLLGYEWKNTDVNVTSVSISDANTSTVSVTGNGSTAGLVYRATGHWTVTSLDMRGIQLIAPSAGSVGMIVNKGISQDAAGLYTDSNRSVIYLELPSGYTYQLSFAEGTNINSEAVFDELCAYTAAGYTNIMRNGNGIISVSTTGLKMESNAQDSLSYKNQTTQGAKANPNARYYYNLDLIDADNELGENDFAQKLMSWGVNQYAGRNIKPYFTDYFETGIPSAEYDLKGYSWYPVNLEKAMTVAGTFTFYNKEFETCEAQKSTANKWSSLSIVADDSTATQHYMMHNGLFYNVSQSITLGEVAFAGTIGALDKVDAESGTGALVYGTVTGKSKNSNEITVISSKDGSISLAGIRIHNLTTHTGYAPLLINKTGNYVTLYINDVSTTAAYKSGDTTVDAATSLIGMAGTSAANEYINITFKDMKLDARSNKNTPNDIAEGTYHTTKSIFTRATFLEQFQAQTGSSGVYDYTYADDHGAGKHKVTYGKEVGYTDHTDFQYTQYPNQERKYSGSTEVDGVQVRYYTNPQNTPDTTGGYAATFVSSFLPYVKSVSSTDPGDAHRLEVDHKNQLQVNHQAAETPGGCGTYNDPYIIANADNLATLSKWIRGTFATGDELCIPKNGTGETWCTTTNSQKDHESYFYNGTSFVKKGDNTKTLETSVVREYLAGAYYRFGNNNIEIDNSDFQGLGDLGNEKYYFHGVIIGNEKTLTNKTKYPLIAYSSGSVVKDLTITVDKSFSLAEASSSYAFPKAEGAYGAVMGQVMGGDNIIDDVQVSFGSSVITVSGSKAQFVPVGGYVGVIVNGGVIFREMSGVITALADRNVATTSTEMSAGKRSNLVSSDNMAWLYVNPIIGRVINGFAVTEADAYAYREANVTMKNSTGALYEDGNRKVKNYSVTDIKQGEELSVDSSYKISVPGGQSFFLMSVIVNSGMGMKTDPTASVTSGQLGYYNSYYYTRYGNYDDVGVTTATEASGCNDYNNDAKRDGADAVPYIIENYTKDESGTYYAQAIGGHSSCTLELTGGKEYNLPDGYRGIGNFYQNDDKYRLNVTSFEGNGTSQKQTVIRMNSAFYHYADNSDGFDQNYYPSTGLAGNDGYAKPDAGFGLFNTQTQNKATYQNFTLSGKIKYDVINYKSGEHIIYDKTVFNKWCLSTGGLFGNFSGKGIGANSSHIIDVALKDLDVRGAKFSGGMIGTVPVNDDVELEIKTTENGSDSSGITVHGGLNAGGLVAKYQQGTLTIDYNEHSFMLNEVISETKQNDNSFNYGVGGLVGSLRKGDGKNDGTASGNLTISNISIGTKDATSAIDVGCSEANCGINTGGLVGTLNKCSPKLENVNLYNVNVYTNGSGSYVGGAVGFTTTFCEVTIKNTEIYTNDTVRAEIRGNGKCGGFLGLSPKQQSDGTYTFTIQNSSIENYKISGDTVGGIVGERDTWVVNGNGYDMYINNFKISDCMILGSSYAGGLAGILKKPLKGYNILANNLSFTSNEEDDVENTHANWGYMVGANDSTMEIVGFSYQGAAKDKTKLNAVGSGTKEDGKNTYVAGNYGSGGYVVFADYAGAALSESTRSSIFSNIHSTNNVKALDGESPVTDNDPYVTSALPLEWKSSYFITGDGASDYKELGSGTYTTDVLERIDVDIKGANPGYYAYASSNIQTVSGYITNYNEAYSAVTAKLSSFAKEMGVKAVDGIDFTVLVVDDVNMNNTTALVNNYLRLLTNTDWNFQSDTNMYSVVLSKCTFSADGSTLTLDDSSCCLKKTSSYFYMSASDTDTAAATAQFSLIDVQFKDPSDSSHTKIAYHLYVPVFVRKLVEYDFRVNLKSGTNYVPAAVISQNTMLENLGVPVTAEFEYAYKRGNNDWQTVVDAGDTLLANYDKKLVFQNSSLKVDGVRAGFESGNSLYDCHTKMVLVDSNNSDRAYYLDLSDEDATGAFVRQGTTETMDTWILDLQKFKDSSGNSFDPVNFNDMLNVEATQSNTGTFLVVTDGSETVADNSGGANDGKKFRLIRESDGDVAASDRYGITVTGGDYLKEHYFLSIYTEADYSDEDAQAVYHYTITTPDTMGTNPYPSRVSVGVNQAAHLLTGYLYDNSLIVTKAVSEPDMFAGEHVSEDTYLLQANLQATIGIADNAKDIVSSYLKKVKTIEIYQSMLVSLNMHNAGVQSKGIKAIKNAYATNYTINGKAVADIPTPVITSNYVEFGNNEPLQQILATKDVVISADVTLVFDEADITGNEEKPAQFYPGPTNGVGTTLIGYSNIASDKTKTAFSKVSKEVEDTSIYYYYNRAESVSLHYSAYADNEIGQYGKLGINAKELEENPVSLRTLGVYNIARFQTSAVKAKYLKIEVELSSNADAYASDLKLADYLTEFEILSGKTAESENRGDKKWVFVYDKSGFELSQDAYQIPVNYAIYTGTTSQFEGAQRNYSNYRVKLTVTMLDSEEEVVSNSYATDFIKYTNARIYTGRVNPNKSE